MIDNDYLELIMQCLDSAEYHPIDVAHCLPVGTLCFACSSPCTFLRKVDLTGLVKEQERRHGATNTKEECVQREQGTQMISNPVLTTSNLI